MDSSSKRKHAADYINMIRTMDLDKLADLIDEVVGDELSEFFMTYGADTLLKDPKNAVVNASTLMLMGYLIKDHEQKIQPQLQLSANVDRSNLS